MTNAVFIPGTGTDVGKTLVSAWLLTHCTNAAYYKPIQCGMPSDTNTIKTLAKQATIYPESYCFSHALSPHLAAQKQRHPNRFACTLS